MEPESLLRKGFRGSDFQRAGIAFVARTGRAIRHHQSQRQTERRIAGASAENIRALETRSRATARVSAGSAIGFAAKLSTHVLEWFLAQEAEGEKWQWHNYPVNQLSGVQNQLPSFMANTHRLLSRKDCDYYLMRLNAVPKKFDQLLESLRVREQKQILPPRFVVEEVLKEMSDFVAKPATENVLSTSFKERAGKIDKLTEKDRADFQARVETAITNSVYPAYRKLIDYFNDLLPKTTTDDGVWKLPDGDAFYVYALRENTTTTLKPQELHDLGLREVARIEGEMRALLDANGFAGQPIGASMDKLGKDPRFLFSK